MPKKFLPKLLLRWLVCGLGLWIAAAILGPDRINAENGLMTFIVAGFILALANMFIKPLLVFLSIPALLLTLGLFLLVVNGALISLVSWLYSSLYIKNFGVAVITGIIIGLVNFLVTHIIEDL